VKINNRHILEKDRKLHRCLAILKKLQDGATLHPRTTADEFGVNERSILRDFQSLSEAGFPLVKKKLHGFSWELMK